MTSRRCPPTTTGARVSSAWSATRSTVRRVIRTIRLIFDRLPHTRCLMPDMIPRLTSYCIHSASHFILYTLYFIHYTPHLSTHRRCHTSNLIVCTTSPLPHTLQPMQYAAYLTPQPHTPYTILRTSYLIPHTVFVDLIPCIVDT